MLFRPEHPRRREEQIHPEGLSQRLGWQHCRRPGPQKGRAQGEGGGGAEGLLFHIAAAKVAEEGACRRGKEEEQIDAPGRFLIHTEKEGHHQQKQRPPAHAPRGNDGAEEGCEKGKKIVCHKRYFPPP